MAVIHSSEKTKVSVHRDTVREIVDVHASIFIATAFSKDHASEKWTEARTSIRSLVKALLRKDIEDTRDLLLRIRVPKGQPVDSYNITIREHMWKDMYDKIDPSDPEAIALVVGVLVDIAHADDLRESVFVESAPESARLAMKENLSKINHALKTFRVGFDDLVIRFLDFSRPSELQEFLRRPDVVKQIIVLMMSPVDTIQEAAQALGGGAFEVDVRLDCFRALLQNFPQAALDGICEYLRTYVQYATRVPEACSLSKALARCLTDVIDVLCSSPNGLLRTDDFRRSTFSLLPKWWNLMTSALSVICRYTPRWATYFENQDMVLWMRDALIFGRDMVAQWRVIESGALPPVDSSTTTGKRRLSQVGKAMMNDLQQVILEMARWLRLTDEELLHQSFALLESLLSCFQDTAVRPCQKALDKLQKHCDSRGGTTIQTILDSSRLQRLREAISIYDDAIEIVDHKIPEPPPKARATEPKEKKTVVRDVKRKSPPPKTKPQVPSRRPVAQSSFTAEDQKKLDASSSLPTFKKSIKAQEVAPKQANGASSTKPAPVSSSSSEESESDDGEKGLASLAKVQRTPKIKKVVERRQVKMLEDLPDPKLIQMQRFQEVRNAQMRLKPDVSGLHRTLLSWDYNHNGPLPSGEPLRTSRVPDTFQDLDHYRRTFEPLLFLECWAQLQESKEDVSGEIECRVSSRAFIDSDWLDLEIVIPASIEKGWNLSDSDVVRLKNVTSDRCTLGKVLSFRASAFEMSASIRCLSRSSDSNLKIGTTWRLRKVLK